MALDISISSKPAAPSPQILDVRAVPAPEAGMTHAAVKPVDSPAASDSKQSAKRANVTMTAEKMQAQLDAAVEQLNKMAVNSGRGLQFKADPKLGRHIIMVTNTETGEVVRTIPTDVAIRVAHGLEDIKGLLHDNAA
jgi:flagellar protein FlaG